MLLRVPLFHLEDLSTMAAIWLEAAMQINWGEILELRRRRIPEGGGGGMD
jgi:hypothetical protein